MPDETNQQQNQPQYVTLTSTPYSQEIPEIKESSEAVVNHMEEIAVPVVDEGKVDISYGDPADFFSEPPDPIVEKSEEEMLQAAGLVLQSVPDAELKWNNLGIVVPGTKDEEVLYRQRNKEILSAFRDGTLEEKSRDLGSGPAVFADAINALSPHRDEIEDQMKRVKSSLPETEDLSNVLKENTGGILNALNQTVPKRFADELIGKEADIGFTILSGGIRRVWLWNSGFYVYLRPMDLATLHAYYLMTQTEQNEHGKMYGIPYYYYGDYEIKRHFMTKVLPKIICGSNYIHWGDTERLLGAISYNDFDLLVLQAAYMLNPEGSPTSFTCSTEKCGHIEQHLSDLSKLQLINTKMVTQEAIDIMTSRSSQQFRDPDIQLYQTALGLNDEYRIDAEDVGSKSTLWTFHRRVPSMAEYLTIGEDLIKILLNATHSTDIEGINDAYRYSQLLMFLPWFSKVSAGFSGNKERYSVQNVVENRSAITNSLNRLMMSSQSKEFSESMKKYAYDTRISQLAYYYPECPKCHTPPKDSIDGYIPFDPVKSFFTLAVRSLNLHG